MQRLLQGRVAIVTGAAQGIGRVVAREMAREGAAVVIADIQEERAQRVREELASEGARVIAVRVDVREPQSVRAMVEAAVEAFGTVDVLVNDAALYSGLQRKPFWEIEEAEWDAVMAVNVRGIFSCCKAVFPVMRERGYGKIVNFSSGSVYRARNQMAHYVASKAAVIGLTRALAREMGPYGIRVNAVAPGATSTEANQSISSAGFQQARAQDRCLGRVQVPEDVAGAVVFLASSLSDFITGQTLLVDGGQNFL